MRRGWASVVLAAGVLAALACGREPSPPGAGDELSRAGFLIEQRQYSEAIYALGERLRRDPNDMKARILLASAYSSRAGIEFRNYSDFASELGKWREIEKLLPGNGGDNALELLARSSFKLELVLRAFESVPTPVSAAAGDDIAAAVDLLDGAPVALKGGPALFRALLRIVIFRGRVLGLARPQLKDCRIEASALARWLMRVGEGLAPILGDIAAGIAEPASRASIERLGAEIRMALANPELQDISEGDRLWVNVPKPLKGFLGSCP